MTSAACCALAPVTDDYTPKGRYETIAGIKTYIVGPEDATKGIIDIYDIFGIWNQTLQGADRLSAHTGAVVLIPDFFDGEGLDMNLVPADTDEKRAKVGEFVATKANFVTIIPQLLEIRKEAAEKFPATEGHWGILGLCFGAKVAVLVCGADNEGAGRKFNVSGVAHPSFLDEKDAQNLNVPHVCLASKEEPADLIAKYKEILAERGEIETYENMHHGWMGARADLKDEANIKEYERGYQQVGNFFLKYL